MKVPRMQYLYHFHKGGKGVQQLVPISLASETTLQITNCDVKYICSQYANYDHIKKNFQLY